eukprot:TRINITY_DN7231_c0_g1_i3.p1 TRINITY_DN7231_c0_g1~~TRINITY_DN7231_c0_g1_i3.p1  ORF type:complete len:256 (+),score=23.43 TRINITY_DN7231_c0_g1_i3:163-930(+)
MYDADCKLECVNRCYDAALRDVGIGSSALFLRASDENCACARETCDSVAGSQGIYAAYSIQDKYTKVDTWAKASFLDFDSLDGCGLNPADELLYCIMNRSGNSSPGAYIVRLATSRIEYIAKVDADSIQADFSPLGDFYVTTGSLSDQNGGRLWRHQFLHTIPDWVYPVESLLDWSNGAYVLSSAGVGGDVALFMMDAADGEEVSLQLLTTCDHIRSIGRSLGWLRLVSCYCQFEMAADLTNAIATAAAESFVLS